MPVLGKSQMPVVMTSYPHFLAADTDVWSRYLADPVVPIAELWYDVHVGNPMDLPAAADAMDRRIAFGVSRKRIDVVARIGAGYWVIEVKPIADMRALGQILNYTMLFAREYNVPGEIFSVVVADELDEDVRDIFEDLGVVVIIN